MNDSPVREDALIPSIFSDETALFCTPAEPEIGDTVAVRLRICKGAQVQATLLTGYPALILPMEKVKTDGAFDWYETHLHCGDGSAVFYSFLIAWKGKYIHYRRTGAALTDSVPYPDPAHSFRLLPGFHVPAWAKGAVQYQIFPDRFRNGDPENDVLEREYHYTGGYVHHIAEWDTLPQDGDFRCFYGGDLPGVMEKLDYLQSLGVEALYLNPIFVSPSNHKYDTQDYSHVDPHLTVIAHDGGDTLKKSERKNVHATAYIKRTTLPENLEASDAYFASFCRELHRRGMKIILDGVFNHCGSFNRWMDKERLYETAGGYRPGAYDHPASPYRNYFQFRDARHYDSWWNVDTLPKLNYENSWELCEEILKIAEKWASPPYSIDGWRLDVGADLGHSREFNHLFWKEFRRRVKAVNPDLLIIAEHYGNPSEWLGGDEWDSVMNYDAFMEPVTWFLTGMEKHSDSRRDDLYQNGSAFFDIMLENMSRMPMPSLQCAMNELSNHDHSRFMTRTNGRPGRLRDAGSAAASEGVQPAVYREAAVIQMTWPGAPTLYYGDEAGLTGWTDPDNRRPYPWGHEDQGLISFHQALAQLRRELSFLRESSVKPLCWGFGFIAYARFDGEKLVVVACNNDCAPQVISLPLKDIGVGDGSEMIRRFLTDDEGFREEPVSVGLVRHGRLLLRLMAHSAAVLIPK
ncbi:MAG: alpha amylase N-terminal ig-like domain-containing protein [Clostridia bacterium]|nr:alpha amylase N-terminal ig-like domain-containing protein [Clostridia bacterium]